MKYPKLLSLFHQDERKWDATYEQLYHSPLACHMDIPIRQQHASKEFPAFFCYAPEIFTILSNMVSSMSRLTHTLDSLPPAALSYFFRGCLIEEIKSTNDIEGVRSTRKEIGTALDANVMGNPRKDLRFSGIVNKYAKLIQNEKIPLAVSQDIRNLYDELLLDEILRSDPANAPDGRLFRKDEVQVFSGKKAIHWGITPESKIINYMDKALHVLNDRSIPLLIRISVFHYLFGYIHPFYDGNGRISRFITSYGLSQFLNPLVAVHLSLTIKRSLKTYYRLFQETNSYGNRGDLTPFIIGFMWMILKCTDRVNEILKEKDTELTNYRSKINRMEITNQTVRDIYAALLQASLFSPVGLTYKEIASTIGKSDRTVKQLIPQIPSGHLIIDKSARAHRFMLNLAAIK